MNKPFHRVLTVAPVVVTLAVGVQWSWNTLAPLFGGSALEFRHALALPFLAATLLRQRKPAGRQGRRKHHGQ